MAELTATGWCDWSRSQRTRPATWPWWASTCSRPAIFEAAHAIEPSARGELEITDAIDALIESDRRVEPHIVKGWWKDTGKLEDMLEANRLVLEDIEQRIDGELDAASRVEGRVVIEKGAKLERTVVRGPAIIGAGARISDSYIGPYTAIDRDVVITGSEVEHSIVLAGSSIRDLARPHGGEPAGEERQPEPERGNAQDAALPGGRQRRHLDPMKILVTGAGGMLGHDVVRVAEGMSHQVSR